MKFDKNKKYLAVTYGDYTDYKTILTGEDIGKWMEDSSFKAGDLIYELGECFEIYNEKKIKIKT